MAQLSGTQPKVVALIATDLSSILDVFFENDKFMFTHFRWWLYCNKLNSYTVDAHIIFSLITKTVLILVAYWCPGHEHVTKI